MPLDNPCNARYLQGYPIDPTVPADTFVLAYNAGTGLYVPTAPGGGGGSGTVTSIPDGATNGLSWVVANRTTTPTFTFTLGNITPGTVAATGNVTGANLSGTNTGDQTITLTGDITGSGTGSFAATIASGVIVDADINASAAIAFSKLAGAASSGANTNITSVALTGGSSSSFAGSASVAAFIFSGALFTSGSGTTTFPVIFHQPTGTTAKTDWSFGSNNGTIYGANESASFTGNFADFALAGVSKFKVTSAGAMTLAAGLSATSGAFSTTLNVTGATTHTAAGAASLPSVALSGVPFAGTGTTSFPLLYINDANATASTTLNTAGTYFGVNGDGTQDLMNLLKDGTSQFKVSSAGVLVTTGAATFSGNVNIGGNFFIGSGGFVGSTSANSTTLIGNAGAANGAGNIQQTQIGGQTNTKSSGTFTCVAIIPTYNQTSTAAGTDLLINRTETALGSGAQLFIDCQSGVSGGVSKFSVSNAGNVSASGTLAVTGIATFGAQVRLKGYTVATLPAGTQGDTAFVTDSLTPAFLVAVVGGGAQVVTVFYNGTNWIVQ